jgi:hypothetical protein
MDRFFSVIDLFRYISVGGIIERQEALVMAIWTGTGLVKIGLYYYCTCLAWPAGPDCGTTGRWSSP